MNREIVFLFIGRLLRALTLAFGAVWIIYRDYSRETSSILVSGICVVAATVFVLTALGFVFSGDQAENLF